MDDKSLVKQPRFEKLGAENLIKNKKRIKHANSSFLVCTSELPQSFMHTRLNDIMNGKVMVLWDVILHEVNTK